MKLIGTFFNILEDLCTDRDYAFKIQLNPDHFVFKAHFPGNPITPGVCITQIVTELLEYKLHRHIAITTVKNIKFLSVIIPNDGESVYVRYGKVEICENQINVQASIELNDAVYAKLSLVYKILD